MAMDKLNLYNNALVLLGQRYLNNLTDNEESQLYLDAVYNFKAVEHCLELSKPVFATKTVTLSVSVASGGHDLDNVFNLPSDYITPVSVFSDSKLDQPISRYIIESRTIACEYDAIYLRYVSNDSATDQTNWTPSFYKLVASYLAKEIAPKIDPNKLQAAMELFSLNLQSVQAEEEGRKTQSRSVSVATVLTDEWLHIYNDALLLMGVDPIATNTDDSPKRVAIDRALNAGAVNDLLESHKWIFATTSYKSQYDPSLESGWGFARVHAKPDSLLRWTGLFTDERMESPLNVYREEADNIFTDHDTVYFEFIDRDYLTNTELWPSYFKRYLAAKLARDAAPSIVENENVFQNLTAEYQLRNEQARALDSELSPPKGMSPSATLTPDWLSIYNDALLCCGLDEITSVTDDSNRKVKLDRALNAGVVSELLEDHPWNFGATSYKSYYDPSLGPSWGYDKVHAKPDAMHRLKGVYVDENFTTPLRDYRDEGDNLFCSYDVIYIEFISDSFINTPDLWPTFFKRMVAAKLANDVSGSLINEGASVDLATRAFMERKSSALSNDAAASPPIKVRAGSWARSRGHSNYGRGRP